MKNERKNNKKIGDSGEYFVAGELSRRNYTVALTTSGTEYFDLLTVSPVSKKKCAIQVKTTEKSTWLLNKKNEDLKEEDLYYVFVNLNKLELPSYYVVPSKIVADIIRNSHKEWLKQPNKKGEVHNDNPARTLKRTDIEKYSNNWNLLK